MIQNQLMKIIQYFKKPQTSANYAKERLQIIIAHERGLQNQPDYFPALQKDLLAVIAKYVDIEKEDVKIDLDYQENCAILELNAILPQELEKKTACAVSS